MTSPKHRLPVDPDLIDGNKYLLKILEKRTKINGSKNADGTPMGPIQYGLKEVDNFACSASEWSEEHLALFHAVVLVEQPTNNIYPAKFLPKANDAVITALDESDFFTPTKDDVRRGLWKSDNFGNNFFLDLAQLIIGAAAPTLSIPTTRTVLPREVKIAARQEIESIIRNPEGHRPVTRSLALQQVRSTESMYTTNTARTSSLIYYEPRETTSHSLFHNLLKSLATLEYEFDDQKSQFWMPS